MRKLQYVVIGGKVVDTYAQALATGKPYDVVLTDYNPNEDYEKAKAKEHCRKVAEYCNRKNAMSNLESLMKENRDVLVRLKNA